MTNVRKMSKTTFSLLFFVILVVVLMSLSQSATGGVFYKLNELLSSKRMIGGYHSFLITLSFWILLIAGFVDSALRELKGIYVLTSFIIPIVLNVIVFFVSLIGLASIIDVRVFWALYYIGEIICIRVMFNKLSHLNVAKPFGMIDFAKGMFKEQEITGLNTIDFFVVFWSRIIVLVDWILLLISFSIYFLLLFI